jgi:hypothetical protein
VAMLPFIFQLPTTILRRMLLFFLINRQASF